MCPGQIHNHKDDYELVPHPKHGMGILGDDYEDAEWDDCDFEVKKKKTDPKPIASALEANKKTSDIKPAAYAPSSSSSSSSDKNFEKKKNPQEKARMKIAAAIKFLEPELNK
ncbi:hypothetical protein ACHAPO_010740 [Fusarium lateritium]